jgi:uncharacterized UBP type Zn finger protein
MICQGGCNKVRENHEDFLNVSVQVRNRKDIDASFDAFVGEELLSDVNCDSCQKRAECHKRSLFLELPKIMLLHLKV